LLKQNHKYWAINDEMLLADGKAEQGPQDIFKMNREPKLGEKPIAKKVTSINHTNNNDLTKVVEAKKGQ